MDQLSVGMAVDISRSDGRMHSAVVAKIRLEQNLVDVEWFESVSVHFVLIQHLMCFRTRPRVKVLILEQFCAVIRTLLHRCKSWTTRSSQREAFRIQKFLKLQSQHQHLRINQSIQFSSFHDKRCLCRRTPKWLPSRNCPSLRVSF